MSDGAAARSPKGVERIFYREIVEGDRRKFVAKSADAKSGGGARDLRVNHKSFAPVMAQLLPDTADRKRRSSTITVHRGPVEWLDADGQVHTDVLEYWPPTDSRPSEGRLAQIDKIGAMWSLPPISKGRLFLLITQQEDGVRHLRIATEGGIERGNALISSHIDRCISSTPDHHAVLGYMDFTTGKTYCHG